MTLGWNDLFFTGSVVDLAVSVWGARIQIKASDLGIEDSEEVRKALSLGSHRLVPPESLTAISAAAGKAQRAVDHHSLNFALIRGARYVPDTALPPLLEKLRVAREEFHGAVSAFLETYEA